MAACVNVEGGWGCEENARQVGQLLGPPHCTSCPSIRPVGGTLPLFPPAQLEESYEHLDFTWGIDAKDKVYPAVLDLLHMYQ